MKRLLVCLSFTISGAASVAEAHTVELRDYLYRGTFSAITESLQEKLAKELVDACGESAEFAIKMKSLSINFSRGELAGKGALEAQIFKDNNRLLVDFPSHPKAIIKASFDCL